MATAAVEKAWQNGIVVVVAAGTGEQHTFGTNDYGTITAPGDDPYVITLGAMKDITATGADDLIASYSSKGPNQFPQSYYIKGGSSAVSPMYYKLSGASMAAPMLSGAAAFSVAAES